MHSIVSSAFIEVQGIGYVTDAQRLFCRFVMQRVLCPQLQTEYAGNNLCI